MLSFYVVNLLIPGNPKTLEFDLPSGTWRLAQHPRFADFKEAIANGQCAETYIIENPATVLAGADAAIEELTPILLGASYFAGLSVTIRRSTMASEASFLQTSEHWPRERAMANGLPMVSSGAEFAKLVERFVHAWPQAGQTEKARLLIHHWLDALSCWSMEDLYLSATTLLQVIVATEAARQGLGQMHFNPGVKAAAAQMGIRVLSDDFKNMRNDLIHEGRLIGTKFFGPDKMSCAAVVADVLNWFDEYLHAALGLGAPLRVRFTKADLLGLNAYSLN